MVCPVSSVPNSYKGAPAPHAGLPAALVLVPRDGQCGRRGSISSLIRLGLIPQWLRSPGGAVGFDVYPLAMSLA
jgi:hypothetical protein